MRLVVTTWNLQGSKGVDAAAVAAHVRERGSDLLLVQEVQRRQARQLARSLEARSSSWAFKHWPVRIPAEGMAVVGVSLPVRAEATALTHRFRWWAWRRRVLQVAVVPLDPQVAGGSMAVVNVHLSSGRTATEREREVGTLLQLPAGKGPMAVAGDLNDLPDSTIAVQLKEAGLRDAWTEVHPGAEGGATHWTGARDHKPPTKRIDYVWVSPQMRVVDAHVPHHDDRGFDRYPPLSDHLPLTVTLEM